MSFDHIRYVLGVDLDLTHRQIAVLSLLNRTGDQQVRVIAQTLKLAKPVITRAVNGLEQPHRFVERRPDPSGDRRSIVIVITAAGRAFLQKIGVE